MLICYAEERICEPCALTLHLDVALKGFFKFVIFIDISKFYDAVLCDERGFLTIYVNTCTVTVHSHFIIGTYLCIEHFSVQRISN